MVPGRQAYKARVTGLDAAIDEFAKSTGDEKERGRGDQLFFIRPEGIVLAVLFKRIGDATTIELVLKSPHAFVKEFPLR